MAVKIVDYVQETSATDGTTSYELAGAVGGRRGFGDALTSTDQVWYSASDGEDWELGVGQYEVAGAVRLLHRISILRSSNGDERVDWGTGTRSVFSVAPGERLVLRDDEGNVTVDELRFEKGDNHLVRMAFGEEGEFGLYDYTAGEWIWYWDPANNRLRIPQYIFADTFGADVIELAGLPLGSAATRAVNSFITGTAQGGALGSITLGASESSVNEVFAGLRIQLTGGTGAGQDGIISAYVGATRVATVIGDNFAEAPDGTSTYQITTGPSQAGKAVVLSPDGRIDPHLIPVMKPGQSITNAGTRGLPPTPQVGDSTKFLRGDSTWAEPAAPFIGNWITSWSGGNEYSAAHGLGGYPGLVWLECEAIGIAGGYSPGERIELRNFAEADDDTGVSIVKTATHVKVRIPAAGIFIASTGVVGAMTSTYWKIRPRAERRAWDN